MKKITIKIKNIILSIICLLMTNLNAISLRDYIAQHGMPKIENGELSLYSKNLTSLDGLSEIPGIENVTTLVLDTNKISKLPENIFKTLVNLTTLDLSDNQIIELPEGIFKTLVNLTILDLSRNQTIELPKNIFNNLVNLKDLFLNDNKIITLPEGIFNDLVKLEYLDLTNNQLETLPENIFNGLINLKELFLDKNKIKLTEEDFKKKYLTNKHLENFKFEPQKPEFNISILKNNLSNLTSNLATLKVQYLKY